MNLLQLTEVHDDNDEDPDSSDNASNSNGVDGDMLLLDDGDEMKNVMSKLQGLMKQQDGKEGGDDDDSSELGL